MGQRSQIYILYNAMVNNQYAPKLAARYFQWNYGERMISRARALVEWFNGREKFVVAFEESKIPKVAEVNFDMRDVANTIDILEEYKEYGNGEFRNYVFDGQDNNDGQLFVDARDTNDIKYCFRDYEDDIPKTAEEYLEWDVGEGYSEEYLDEDEKKTLSNNIEYLVENARVMTKDELNEFMEISERMEECLE